MAQCPKCGAPVPGKFCPNCGTPLASMPQPPEVQTGLPAAQQPAQSSTPPQPPAMPYQQPGAPYQQPGMPYQQPGMLYQQPGMPYQQPGMPYQQPVRRKNWMGIVSGVIGALTLVVMLLIWLGGSGTTTVSKLTITDKVADGTMEPARSLTSVPPNTSPIYAAVYVEAADDATVSVKWYIENEHIAQVDKDVSLAKDDKGWVAFSITNTKPWPATTYKVEIYLNGAKQAEQTFTVK